LYSAQFPEHLGADWWNEETNNGWPLLYFSQWFPAGTALNWGALAADVILWAAVLAATVYVSWRAIRSRLKFSLASLFVATTAAALILAWWRVECVYWSKLVVPEPPSFFGTFEYFTPPYEPDTPMLRLVRFSPYIYVPVLIGIACLFICVIMVVSAAAKLGIRAIRGRVIKKPAW
jgi:hypothetical protein